MELIAYPDRNNPDLEEWKRMVQDIEIFTGGLLFLAVENINTTGVPRILENSRLDINGSKYACVSAETISSSNAVVNNAVNYVYAVGNGNTAYFRYRADEPTWNPAKGGWYYANERAIIKFYALSGIYSNKVVLDSQNAKELVNSLQSIPPTGGTQVSIPSYTNNQPYDASVTLAAGMYRYELKGGDGGPGGAGGIGGTGKQGSGYTFGAPAVNGQTGQAGVAGGSGTVLTGVFYHKGGSIRIKVGKNGGPGGDGGLGGDGGNPGNTYSGGEYSTSVEVPGTKGGNGGPGGGGGAGEESRIGDIVASGGIAGAARIINHPSGLVANATRGWPDGIAGDGGIGDKGDDGTGQQGATTGKPGKAGQAGGTLSTTSLGYARLWRVG
jgi:hypothetical protein